MEGIEKINSAFPKEKQTEEFQRWLEEAIEQVEEHEATPNARMGKSCKAEGDERRNEGLHLFYFAGLTLHFTLAFKDPAFINFELGRNQGSIDFSG